MLTLRENLQVFIQLEPVDFRKSINGLSAIVFDELKQNPQSGHLFVFYNKTKNKLKLLYWDRNGFVLHYKRLERERFRIPKKVKDGVIEINQDQLNWLLAGLDFLLMNTFSELNYSHYY